MFSLDTIKTLLQQHLQSVEAMLQPHVTAFVTFLENEDAKAKAEVQHLASLGYTIIHPAVPPTLTTVAPAPTVTPATPAAK